MTVGGVIYLSNNISGYITVEFYFYFYPTNISYIAPWKGVGLYDPFPLYKTSA